MPHIKSDIKALLHQAGYTSTEPDITPVNDGANNRGFTIQIDGKRLFAKHYFSHPSDPRDRPGAEVQFLAYAWEQGIRNIPQIIISAPEQRLVLFQYIAGKKLSQDAIKPEHIQASGDFIARLNAHREHGQSLPIASDGFFRIADHIPHLEKRIAALKHATIRGSTPVRKKAYLLMQEIDSAWQDTKATIAKGHDIHAELPSQARCISPSDFGFHNALYADNGTLFFLDFEYAGWDDPAKLCCDFFCQPEIPVSIEYFQRFIGSALKSFVPLTDMIVDRTMTLFPLCHLKWCCIILNPFLHNDAKRRGFATSGLDLPRHQSLQLDKASRYFKDRENTHIGLH